MEASERPWRCFVAVPIGEGMRDAVATCVSRLRAADGAEAWRWTDAEAWHVTLAFLGATDPAAVPGISAALVAVAAEQVAFGLQGGGIGAFPSRRRARVLWYGIADPDGRLRALANRVRVAIGMADDDRFRAHLTLARCRERVGLDATILASVSAAEAPLAVDRLVLYRSHLGRGPARYEVLSSAPIGGIAS